MINLEKIKSEKSQPPPPFKKTCPYTILPPPFLKFSSYPVPGDIIKIYFFKGGGGGSKLCVTTLKPFYPE